MSKCLVPVNITNVSTGIRDVDTDTEQNNDANLLSQHKEQWRSIVLIAMKLNARY